ncbi:MAG: ATP-binding cassette domain-containing protein, partial [Acidimicrobiales bacterium]
MAHHLARGLGRHGQLRREAQDQAPRGGGQRRSPAHGDRSRRRPGSNGEHGPAAAQGAAERADPSHGGTSEARADATSPAIAIEGLSKRYDNLVALDGLSFEVPAGSVVGLLGPNGSGKTTTVAILSTALRPEESRANVGDHDVARDPAAVRRLIGFADQYAAVDANLTGAENLTLIARLSRVPRSNSRPHQPLLLGRGAQTEGDRTGPADHDLRCHKGELTAQLD